MKIRILDRILVAIAGLLVLAGCAALTAQLFFNKTVSAWAGRLLADESLRIWLIVALALLVILGVYCVLILFRHRSRHDKFVMQKTENGELSISLKAMESMVQKCLDPHKELNVQSVRLENQKGGLLIRIRGTVAGGVSIPLTVDALQQQIKQYVTACSGVEIKGIRLLIESSGEDATDAPFLIEPPIRLPKGTEDAKTDEISEAEAAEAVTPSEKPEGMPAAETPAVSESAAAAAALAAAESMRNSLEFEEDDRPIHQQLFSTQEEPCIMPLPPESLVSSEKQTSVTSETAEVSTSEEKIKAEKTAPETDDTKA